MALVKTFSSGTDLNWAVAENMGAFWSKMKNMRLRQYIKRWINAHADGWTAESKTYNKTGLQPVSKTTPFGF